ncbi:MAG: hypothetical protein J6S24_08835 [Lentisphaeria bacterium]|nr:hypothetical protein [Lentisphaeria bacterium]MBO5766380.1 hypothetical protein [Lentisphaeria bacterium]MBO7154009.1 hypothetical protein [Lentisphaeria bacterium]
MEFTRKILFAGTSSYNHYLTPEEFRQTAEIAAEVGFTHIDLGCSMIERSRHQLTNNGVYCKNYDFYTEYTAAFPSYFKFFVPEALRPYLPEETAKRNLEAMHVRAEILQSLGLKGAFFGAEPQFLPEQAYEDHPSWRGARSDFSGRSIIAYFSPCIDQQEIRDLYGEAAEALSEAAPCLDYIHMLTGDSGAGICWGQLYTGTNGPAYCEHVPMAQRISTFCEVLAEPMRKRGHADPMAILHRSTPWGRSAPVVKAAGAPGGTVFAARAALDKPVSYEDPVGILEEIAKADGFDNIIVNIEAPLVHMAKDSIYPQVIKSAFESVPRGTVDIAARIQKAAAQVKPEYDSEKFTDAMFLINQAARQYRLLNCNLFYGCMSERWITRPFLIYIPDMDDEETAYYRNYIFNVNGEAAFKDILDYHGNRWIRFGSTPEEGRSSAHLCFDIISKLERAIKLLGAESEIGFRIRALRALIKNIRHLLLFTGMHDRLKKGETFTKDDRTFFGQVMRAEIDNCDELIEVLEKGPANVFPLAPTKEAEHTFMFGPDFADQLRLKKKQMVAHWHDLDDLLIGKKPPIANIQSQNL